AVHRLDPKLSKEEDGFKCAVVLMTAALATGPNIVKVSKFCGYPRTLVRRFATNLRASRIWGHKYVRPSDWSDKKAGGVAFWLDVAVGLGFVERTD
ncbi:hypothetical protein LCGC14_2960160, partial [marine sediment metagenome]